MKFNEAFNNLMNGKAIRISCGTVEYPPLIDLYFLLDNHNKIIDSNGYDVTFNILQCSMDDTLEWEVYEPTKEELLFEIIELKKNLDAWSPYRGLNKHGLLEQRLMQNDGSARLK